VTSDGVSSSSRVGWMPAEHVTGLEINLDAEQCRVLDLGLHVIKVSPKPVPNIRRSSSRPMRTLQTPGFKPFPAPQAIRADGTALLSREVLSGVGHGNKEATICSGFVVLKEPSDGLEPSTPSLPSSNEAGTAGKAGKPRARKSRKKKESPEDE
jgi:hypothetical protein